MLAVGTDTQVCAGWTCLLLQVSGWQGARELHSDHGSVVVYRGMTDCFLRTGMRQGWVGVMKQVSGCLLEPCAECGDTFCMAWLYTGTQADCPLFLACATSYDHAHE